MSISWLVRTMIGPPLEERDLDDLIEATPEFFGEADAPVPLLLAFPFWRAPLNNSHLKELQDRWLKAAEEARKKLAAAARCKRDRSPRKGGCPGVYPSGLRASKRSREFLVTTRDSV
jgi:hypothetical protein